MYLVVDIHLDITKDIIKAERKSQLKNNGEWSKYLGDCGEGSKYLGYHGQNIWEIVTNVPKYLG